MQTPLPVGYLPCTHGVSYREGAALMHQAAQPVRHRDLVVEEVWENQRSKFGTHPSLRGTITSGLSLCFRGKHPVLKGTAYLAVRYLLCVPVRLALQGGGVYTKFCVSLELRNVSLELRNVSFQCAPLTRVRYRQMECQASASGGARRMVRQR